MDPPLIIGNAVRLLEAKQQAERLAGAGISVCLLGESGCGKEVFARYVHSLSGRNGQFVPLNCGGLGGDLVRSHLFGHEAGAFTGARERREGVFERARDGTVFLDEIGDLPLDVQVQLLRVLETKQVERVGAEKLLDCNFRLVCATNHDLKRAVEEGSFRQDLYYRVASSVVTIPPLRDRLEDISDLIKYFYREFHCDVPDWTVWEPTQGHDWPGNVRELRGFVDYVVVVYGAGGITRQDVEVELQRHRVRVPRIHLSPSGKPETVCPDLERLRPYMAKLGLSPDPSSEPVASLAAYLGGLTQEQRQEFLGKGYRIPQDSILLTIVADAIALACLEQADQRKTAPVDVAVDDFGMHRMREKRLTDLAALERAVYDRLKR